MRRIGMVALAALVGLGGVGVAPRLPDGGVQGALSAGYAPDAEECRFLNLINDYRRRNGRPELGLSATLGAAAEHHSADMARKNYFSHSLPGKKKGGKKGKNGRKRRGGISWSENIRRHGYRGNPIGENIAAGPSDAATALRMWENSAGHRRNMLNPDFRAIGIGRAHNANARYDWYWTTTFGGPVDRAVGC